MIKNILSLILCILILVCFVSCGENTDDDALSTENTSQNKTNNESIVIFDTENVKRITFYSYYGDGKGSDVPAENLDEIITWLDSFKVGEEVPIPPPPGTNTHYIEIEYLDGRIVKEGMDTTAVNEVAYYIKGDHTPECYWEIISKTSLN